MFSFINNIILDIKIRHIKVYRRKLITSIIKSAKGVCHTVYDLKLNDDSYIDIYALNTTLEKLDINCPIVKLQGFKVKTVMDNNEDNCHVEIEVCRFGELAWRLLIINDDLDTDEVTLLDELPTQALSAIADLFTNYLSPRYIKETYIRLTMDEGE